VGGCSHQQTNHGPISIICQHCIQAMWCRVPLFLLCCVVCHCHVFLQVCLTVLYNDNQANGVLAIRLFGDLSKHLVRNQVTGFEQQFNEALNFMHKVWGVGCIGWVGGWWGP